MRLAHLLVRFMQVGQFVKWQTDLIESQGETETERGHRKGREERDGDK